MVRPDQRQIDLISIIEKPPATTIGTNAFTRLLKMLVARASSSLGSKGFDVTVLKEKADTITPEHLNYFHPDSLVKLVESVGFKTIDISTPRKLDVDIVRKKVEPGIHSLDNDLFLKRIIIDKYDVLGANFQAFLSSNRLSSHQWLVARKED